MKELLRALKERGLHIAFAESCTGGLLAERLTSLPGASEVFACGIVTYSNEMKMKLLSVSKSTIEAHTEVSAACAREMAEGCAAVSGAELALAVTGYAGPGGGTAQEPVGTVYIGVYFAGKSASCRFSFEGNRQSVREKAAGKAIELAKNAILAEKIY